MTEQEERIEYYELSAKTGHNVESLFKHAAELLSKQIQDSTEREQLEQVLFLSVV